MANISTTIDLVINKLSQAKYEQLCAAGQLDEHQLYITDDDRAGELSNEIRSLSDILSTCILSIDEQLSGKLSLSSTIDQIVNIENSNITITNGDQVISILSSGHIEFSGEGNSVVFQDGTSNEFASGSIAQMHVGSQLSLDNGASISLVDWTQMSASSSGKNLSAILSSKLEKEDVKIGYDSGSRKIVLSSDTYTTSVDCNDFIKDGMLSTVELCGTTLWLNFNTDAGVDPISVELSSFVDNYDSKISFLSSAIDDRAMISDIPLSTSQLKNDSDFIVLSDIPDDLSAFGNSPMYVMSSEISSQIDEISLKSTITIDDHISSLYASPTDLSIIKLSANEYAQLAANDETLSNCLYIVEDNYEDAYGLQIKNLAPGTDLSDAVNLEQLSNVISSIQIPSDLSSFTNSPGYLVSNDISGYYKKSETSSASEISDAIAQAGKGYDVTVRYVSRTGTNGTGYAYVGGYEFEAVNNDNPGGLIVQHVNSGSLEYLLHGQSIVVVPNGNYDGSTYMVYVNGSPKNNEVVTLTGDTLVELYYIFCLLEGTKILLADGTEKNIEDVTYDDILKVWNFDEGKLDDAKPFWINKPSYTYYWWETKLKSGKMIKTTGIYGHRLFNIDKNTFVYASELKAGDRVFTVDGIDVVSSSTKVEGLKVNFYNIITDNHINVIANKILAGCSLENGLYPVKDMRFVKDGRAIRPYSEFEGVVSEEWYRACRYGESSLSYNYLCNYFRQRNPKITTKKTVLLANSGVNDLSSYGIINMHNYTLHNVGCGQMSSDVMNYKQMTDEIADMLSASLVSSIGTIPISSFDGLPDLKCSVNSIFDMLSNIVGILKKGSS